MPDDDKNNGGGGSGSGAPPVPSGKTAEQRLAELEESNKKIQATYQSAQEELKRVSNLNAVLMQRLQGGGNGNPTPAGNGMDVSRTTPIKLKRDFSQMDPASNPQQYATELVLEVAEQTRDAIAASRGAEERNAALRKNFYEGNRDLVGWERLVGTFSDEVQAENPGMTFDQAAVEISKRTREFIKTKGLKPADDPDTNNPGGVIPPGGQNNGDIPIKPPKGGGGDGQPFNPDKAYAEDMKSYMDERGKERTGSKK